VADDERNSSLAEAVARIGDRWSLLIIDALLSEPRRFGELQDQVGGIAPNILTTRLRSLEAEGIVVAAPYSERPLRMTYELTEVGRQLAGALALLESWGQQHAEGHDAGFHRACGAPLETRLWCSTCERVVDEPEATDDVNV
jgi:DNA-binding HxlR family transcriptional regulator